MKKHLFILLVIMMSYFYQSHFGNIFKPVTNYREIINLNTDIKGSVSVAVIDNGFNEYHSAIADSIFHADYHEKSNEDHGLGVVGVIHDVAPGAQIYYYENFSGYDALENVLSSGAKILNISWGNPGVIMKNLIQKIVDNNIIIVKSAGNDGIRINDIRDTISWSELASMPEMQRRILIVGSVEMVDGKMVPSDFSNYSNSKNFPIVYAPGRDIKVISKKGSKVVSGTSFSAPQVSGMLAILMEKFPRRSPEWYIDLVQHTCNDYNGIKVINVKEALREGSRIYTSTGTLADKRAI